MDYKEALAYLDGAQWFGAEPSLRRIRALLSQLGDPQKKLKIVHIAGTNGKGSCAAMLASVLRAAGYRTGLYTSPYLFRFSERMQINGERIDDASLVRCVEAVRGKAEKLEEHPTEFELMTAVALLWFLQEKAEIVVLETGLGGRFDATNAIDAPECSVIMNIALNNANQPGNDKIVRKSHHYMPINFSMALKYKLNHRFALETGLSYSRLKSEFEMGSSGNTINEQQTIHYLGIPVKGIYNIYNRKTWSFYGSLGLSIEIPVHTPLNTSYYLHGVLEATEKTTIRAPWQWSVGTGLGLQYNFTPNIGLFAEPSLQYYIPTGTQIQT